MGKVGLECSVIFGGYQLQNIRTTRSFREELQKDHLTEIKT